MFPPTSPRSRTVLSIGVGRREFLRVGSGALGGLSLPGFLSSRGLADSPGGLTTGRSVIFLFLHGGPSQIETFDPKMSAPVEVRSATGELKTRVPGLTVGGGFPKLAARADQFAVVRSFLTGDANHDIKPIVGKDSAGANLGSIFAHVAGASDPVTGIPVNAALFPRAVDPAAQPHITSFGDFLSPGPFGAATAPFAPGGGGQMQRDLRLSLPIDRLDDRRQLLRGLDRMKTSLDEAQRAGVDSARERALRVLLGTVAEAFDLSR